MKLATIENGTPDGALVVVSADGSRHLPAAIATLQAAIESWETSEPALRALAARLDAGEGDSTDGLAFAAPLPRAWQWLDGSAYRSHGELMETLFGTEPPPPGRPLMYQGLSHQFLSATADVPLPDDLGIPCDGRRADAYHFLHRAHRTDGRPFAVGEVYLAADVFARYPEAFRHGASVPVLDRFPGLKVNAARQRLSIVPAGAESASALELAVGAPVAELRRFACVDDVIVYYARIEFPTEYVCLDFDLLAPHS